MKKVFISQPMRYLTHEEIVVNRERAVAYLESQGYEVLNPELHEPKVPNDCPNRALHCLGSSLQQMSYADVAYFCNGWREARGCAVEHFCAKSYGLETLYEDGKVIYEEVPNE